MRHCREIGALYVDTVVEPWPGFYYDKSLGNEARTNYALRETVLAERRKKSRRLDRRLLLRRQSGHGVVVRQAGARQSRSRSRRQGVRAEEQERNGRASRSASASRACISPSATPSAPRARSRATCSSTPGRSKVSCRKGMQPAELGWGSHEKWAPPNAGFHKSGCGAAIYINQPGANTRVRSWTPTARGQFGFLVTHNESISIADYYTVRDDKGAAVYRPTCHYAYHPCDDAVLSLHELFGRAGEIQSAHHILGRSRDPRRDRRTGRASLRPRPQRLLVRLAALGRGDARARALSERDGHAGDFSGSGGHGLGAGESRKPELSRRTNWTSAAASRFRRPISGRSSAPTRTGRRLRVALAFSRRISTRAIRGSSGTCWCAKAPAREP